DNCLFAFQFAGSFIAFFPMIRLWLHFIFSSRHRLLLIRVGWLGIFFLWMFVLFWICHGLRDLVSFHSIKGYTRQKNCVVKVPSQGIANHVSMGCYRGREWWTAFVSPMVSLLFCGLTPNQSYGRWFLYSRRWLATI